jgi:iron complex transport system permease protein
MPARRASTVRRIGWTAAAAAALLVAVLLSLGVGARAIPPPVVLDAMLHGGGGQDGEVVRELRLPRTLVALLVGSGLALAGSVLQGLTRNPIADPGILGISQGASLGVVISIAFFGVTTLSGYIWFAFGGAAIGSAVVYAIASSGRGGATPVKLALGGAALSALLVSVTMGILATRSATLDEFRFWQVGSVAGRDPEVAAQLWPLIALGAVMAIGIARGLDALALGDEMATGLGQRVALIRVTGAAAATVLTGAAVAAAGPIAFIGLAVPHIARALVGGDHRWMLPLAALIGPVMLLVSDVIGRIVLPPGEVPAGVMTALIGVPFLITLVRRKAVPA